MKKSKWVLPVLLVLLLTGCSLARAEADPESRDRWVGLYVVPAQDYGRDGFYNNPYLEEYGSDTVKTEGFGTLTFPREVLFAVKDEAGNYTFPGMETGFSLFYVEMVAGHGHYTKMVSNMGPHDDGAALAYTDEGSSIAISGTVYRGSPLGVTDWNAYEDGTVWHLFRVYQTEDGRVYINGDGDSIDGLAGCSQTEKRTDTRDGETVREETFSVTVDIKAVPRLERLVVTQFDESNNLLQSDDLSLLKDRPEIRCQAETAWVLVEEIGPDGTERTVYSVPEGEDPVSHDYVLLDDDGYGYMACLHIYAR